MEGPYALYFGGQAIGKVQVTRQGLYYRFSCRCRLSGGVVCKVLVRCGGISENLGILAPEGEGFSLVTRMPVKRFSGGSPEFTVVPNRPDFGGNFAPIYPEEPFAYIEKLKEAFLVRRGGQCGILIPDSDGGCAE